MMDWASKTSPLQRKSSPEHSSTASVRPPHVKGIMVVGREKVGRMRTPLSPYGQELDKW